MTDDRLVQLEAADADRLAHDDPAHRENGDLARAAADVDHHAALCLRDREAGSDRRRHRLLDQGDTPGSGRERRFLDRVPLDVRDPARHAEHDAGERKRPAANAADEVTQHFRRDVEVRDHAVTQRADGADRRGRPSDHAARVLADGAYLVRPLVDGDDGRLEDRDPLAPDEHERVRRA